MGLSALVLAFSQHTSHGCASSLLLEIAEKRRRATLKYKIQEKRPPFRRGGSGRQRRSGAQGNAARPPRPALTGRWPLLPGPSASGLANFQLFAAQNQIFLINNKRFCWDQSCFPPSLCKPRQQELCPLAFQGTSYYGGQESPSRWMKSILSCLVTSVLTFKARKETR